MPFVFLWTLDNYTVSVHSTKTFIISFLRGNNDSFTLMDHIPKRLEPLVIQLPIVSSQCYIYQDKMQKMEWFKLFEYNICCFCLYSITVNWLSLSFGLFVEENDNQMISLLVTKIIISPSGSYNQFLGPSKNPRQLKSTLVEPEREKEEVEVMRKVMGVAQRRVDTG